jgi:hypothetical protein
MSQHLEQAQSDVKHESQSSSKPDQKVHLKTKFNEAEYKRWSEKLQASRNGKRK